VSFTYAVICAVYIADFSPKWVELRLVAAILLNASGFITHFIVDRNASGLMVGFVQDKLRILPSRSPPQKSDIRTL